MIEVPVQLYFGYAMYYGFTALAIGLILFIVYALVRYIFFTPIDEYSREYRVAFNGSDIASIERVRNAARNSGVSTDEFRSALFTRREFPLTTQEANMRVSNVTLGDTALEELVQSVNATVSERIARDLERLVLNGAEVREDQELDVQGIQALTREANQRASQRLQNKKEEREANKGVHIAGRRRKLILDE